MRQIFTMVGLLFFSSLSCMSAQVSEGGLAGSVRDPRNASVPDAMVEIQAEGQPRRRESSTNRLGSFRFVALPPGDYRVRIESVGFNVFESLVHVGGGSESTLSERLTVAVAGQVVSIDANPESISQESIQTTNSVIGATVGRRDIGGIPLAHRSFANIAHIAPMTAPVEASDPNKARITAVSFGGSSGLNVDHSIDGGDNNDDYIGGFLQNYSPDSGGERWRGELGGYFRGSAFNGTTVGLPFAAQVGFRLEF